MDMEKYLYRKQYIFGSYYCDRFTHWQRIPVGDEYFLTAHPELEVTKECIGGNFIFLLGYILDPYNPRETNGEILQKVLRDAKTADELFPRLAGKCGRYVVLAQIDDRLRIFSDAAGMRQVFHYTDETGELWCASQPHIIADHFKLSVEETTRADLKKTLLFASDSNYWYPGSVTLFSGICHLMPNHYLDVRAKATRRYWPNDELRPLSTRESAEKGSALLRGIIDSACYRFANLALAISSGLDSRLLLAATKNHTDKIKCFTHVQTGASNSDINLAVPSSLCKKLGVRHEFVETMNEIDGQFESAYKENVFTARKSTMSNAYAIHRHFKLDREDLTVIYGNCAEITKRDRSRYPRLPQFLITAESIAEMALLSHSTTALREFEQWLMTVKPLARSCNVNVLDLLHWEYRVGSWAAMSFHEYEMVFEVICPYSCRHYIECLLSVPSKYRTKPDYTLQYDIAQILWPQTLELPVNPADNKFKKSAEDFLYRTNLYDALKYLFIMYYRRYKVPTDT